ncbi:MAG: uracil-DNA glycosylase [bacterium]
MSAEQAGTVAPQATDAPTAPELGSPVQQLDARRPPVERRSLADVQAELGDCTRCKLHKGRTKLVFGTGNPHADIVFVGEGPGEDEDKQGEPFVGRAGQLLTRIIEDGMGLARSDVYICNIVKCRPPQNREPERDEIDACLPFLAQQIAAIGPKVVVTLGRPSTSTLLGRAVSISSVRGKWFDYRGVPLMPTFHPAYVLRRYTPEVRRQVWEDMKEVLRKIGREPPTPRRGSALG